jgi:hypothetical protein
MLAVPSLLTTTDGDPHRQSEIRAVGPLTRTATHPGCTSLPANLYLDRYRAGGTARTPNVCLEERSEPSHSVASSGKSSHIGCSRGVVWRRADAGSDSVRPCETEKLGFLLGRAEPGRATMARWFVHSIGGPRRSRGLLTGHRRHSGPVCRVRNELDERAVKPVHV